MSIRVRPDAVWISGHVEPIGAAETLAWHCTLKGCATAAALYAGFFLWGGGITMALLAIDGHQGSLTLLLGLVVGFWGSYRLLRRRGELA